MKIGYDAKRAFHNFRGLGNFSRTLLSNYSRQYNDELVLFTTPTNKSNYMDWFNELSNASIVEPQSIIAQKLSSLWRSLFLSKIIKKYDLDIFHGLSHELPPGISKLPLKKIVTIHDLIYVKFPHFFSPIDRGVYEKKFSYSVNTADMVIAICENTKRDIIEHFKCDPDKIQVVYQSCDARYYSAPSAESIEKVKSDLNLPEKFFFYIGAIEQNKNIASTIKALLKVESDHQFIIGGRKTKYQAELELLISELGLSERVRFVNNVSNEEIHVMHTLSELFVFPSFYEGFGIPVIEAIFSGTPVITSDQGALREAGGAGALYIDPNSVDHIAEAINKVINDNVLRQNLIDEGKKHVQRFTDVETAKQLNALYRSIVQ